MRYDLIEGANIIEPLEINDSIYNKILIKLERSTSIRFKYYQKNYVIKRIKSRVKSRNLPSEEAYYDYLKDYPKEAALFLDNFTINYSYFFRNYSIYEKLLELMEEEGLFKQDYIRIWSCPCASGEEPYTIAMILEETKKRGKNLNYEITASDININAIDTAKTGIYGAHALNETPKSIKKEYFRKISEKPLKYKLSAQIKDKVEFINEDITKRHRKYQKYDIIFCRNFIIYINETYRSEVLKNLKCVLKDQGILVLGKTETINNDPILNLIDPRNQFFIKSHEPLDQENQDDNKDLKGFPLKENYISEKVQANRKKKENVKMKKKQIKTKNQTKPSPKRKEEHILRKEKSHSPVKIIEKPYTKKSKWQSTTQKKVIPLEKLNKKLNTKKAQVITYPSNISKNPNSENNVSHLKKLRKKIEKEMALLQNQRKELERKISEFQKQQKHFDLKKKKFKRKRNIFKQEKTQYQMELEWFKRSKERFQSKKNQLKQEKEIFLRKKRKYESEMQKPEGRLITSKEKGKKQSLGEEYTLSLGNYILLKKNEDERRIKTISMYGLGSSYILILADTAGGVYCVSHILFSKPKKAQKTSHIKKPHQYASLCVSYLVKEMLLRGASEKRISAYIIGGAQIFNKKHASIKETYSILIDELNSYNIILSRSDIAGRLRRTVKYNLNEAKPRLRYEGEEDFIFL